MKLHLDDDGDSVISEYFSLLVEVKCVYTGADDPAEGSKQTVKGVFELIDIVELIYQKTIKLEYHVDKGCVAKHISIIRGKVNIRAEPNNTILNFILGLELMQRQREGIRYRLFQERYGHCHCIDNTLIRHILLPHKI